MTWHTYRIVFRLRSPLHIGCGKIGNLQRTRLYVTGRVLWGALTQRLTRDAESGPATNPRLYQAMGERVHNQLAFTYFFPTTDEEGCISLWPWDKGFRSRFMSSWASTALKHPQRSADEGTLHEVECIVPHTIDTDQPVYLTGYMFARADAPDWQSVLHRLQLGGEQGYGWGKIDPAQPPQLWSGEPLFEWYTIESDTWPPILQAGEEALLPAHALAANFLEAGSMREAVTGVKGSIEPVVGRETHPKNGRRGVWISQARICYPPGSRVPVGTRLQVGPFGIWEAASQSNI